VADERETGIFEYDGKPVEAWKVGRRWHVVFGGREFEARSLDEALEDAFGIGHGIGDRDRRLSLTLTILANARRTE
jgi:hypothetical protein